MRLIVAAGLLLASGMARAGALDPKYIPADAKWLVHVDVDALLKSQTYAMVIKEVEQSQGKDFLKQLAQYGEAIGTRIPDDIRDATLIGNGFDEKSAVLVVHAKMDKDRLIGMAKVMKEYTSSAYGGKEISNLPVNIDGDAGTVSGTLLADDVLVLARTPKQVERMIDLSAGKEKPAPAGNILAKGVDGAEVMIYLAADSFAEVQKQYPVSPILGQVSSARVGLSEKADDVVIKAILDMTSDDVAKQGKGALEGLKAMVNLAAMDPEQDEETKVFAQLMKRSATRVEGNHVIVDWPVPLATVRGLIENGELQNNPVKKAATTQNAKPQADR
jgi:hypothetical protein